jgi:hypothetical protein
MIKTLKILILIFWFIMVGLLIERHYRHRHAEPISFASVEDVLKLTESWMGIYMGDQKIGYAFSSIKRVGDRYNMSEHTLMYLTLGGTKQRIESRLTAAADVHFSLTSFSFSLKSGGTNYSLDGTVEDNALHLVVESGKHTSKRIVPLSSTPYLANTARLSLFSNAVEVGNVYRLPFFDPSTMTASELTVSVEAREELEYGGEPIQAYRIKESFKGLTATAWITEEGLTLREESSLGIVLVREDQQSALSGSWTGGTNKDLMVATAVPVAQSIRKARSVNRLTVKLDNVALHPFDLDGGRQKLDRNVVRIERESPGSWQTFSLPFRGDSAVAHYLRPSPLIQSDHRRIVAAAREVTENSPDAEKAARALLSWVYNYLDKEPTVSVPSALEVLDLRSGDCNEHAALYAALCRARGIPTRVCAGLLYLDGSFFYHAWTEIFLGQWVAVDPALNQFPADATHIRLVVGDLTDQIKLLNVVGTVELTVVDYS